MNIQESQHPALHYDFRCQFLWRVIHLLQPPLSSAVKRDRKRACCHRRVVLKPLGVFHEEPHSDKISSHPERLIVESRKILIQ